MRRSGVRASPGANILAAMFAFVRYWCVPLIFYQLPLILYQSSSGARARFTRRTYKSVQTEKCQGREFEPPLEQIF